MAEKQYIYIVQASTEQTRCKIGITTDLKKRLETYNTTTGQSKNTKFEYLFACEVKEARQIENSIKQEFADMRETPTTEIYFYTPSWFAKYVAFIKSHKAFVKEILMKPENKKQIVQIVRKTAPSLEERGTTRKGELQKAQKIKNDEFYTRYEDIEKEVGMYPRSIWKNKTVFCNCDDAIDENERNTSAFSMYFLDNFKKLGLKKLICTHYSGGLDLFNQGAKGYYVFTKNGFSVEKVCPLNYTGSFDDPISLKLLHEEADIVCTNPPFSRAIEYWKTVIESKKKFLIISNITNVITPAFIPYFRNYRVWAGYNRVDTYLNPKRQPVEASGHWYTNIPIKDRPKYEHLKIVPLKDIPAEYKKYDDSEMLAVDNCYIPSDYGKPFAVSARPILNGLLEKGYRIVQDTQYFPYVNGKKCFGRALVQKI